METQNPGAEVGDLITKAAAARLRGVARSTMSELILSHKLTVVMICDKPFVRQSEVLSLPRRRRETKKG
jgi:hypothetical protein